MDSKELGQRIRSLRERNCYTREAFSEKIGISSKFLYEIEMGKKNFSSIILVNIANSLKVSCDYIIFGYELSYNEIDKDSLNKIINILSKFSGKQIESLLLILEEIYNLDVT